MERFKPVGTPIWKKVLGSPFLFVALTFAVVFGSIHFIRQQQREELRARVEYLKGGPVLVERQQSSTETAVAQNSETDAQTAQSLPAESEDVNSGTAASTAPQAEPPPTPPDAATPAAAQAPASVATKTTMDAQTPKPATRAVIHYAEIEQSTLNIWMEEMRTSGQLRTFDEVAMGALPQISQKLKTARGVKILQQLEHNFPTGNTPIEWFVGTHRTQDTENEMGFFTSLILGDMKDGLIRGEIEVQRAFRLPKEPMMERISYGGPFEMAPGSGYVMRGLLPRKYITTFDDEAQPDPFLSIFKSIPFHNGQSEFTLIVEFDTSGSQQR